MTLNKENLEKLLDKTKEYFKHLQELKQCDKKEFLEDWKIYELVDRELYLAIESCINIGEVLISGYDWRRPENYKDVMKILVEKKVLDSEFGKQMMEMVRFRNKLAHDYLYLNQELIYEYLQNNLGDFKKFMICIKEYVENVESFKY